MISMTAWRINKFYIFRGCWNVFIARFMVYIAWRVRGKCFSSSVFYREPKPFAAVLSSGSSVYFLCPHWGLNTEFSLEKAATIARNQMLLVSHLWLLRTTWEREVWNSTSKIENVWLEGFIFFKKNQTFKRKQGVKLEEQEQRSNGYRM